MVLPVAPQPPPGSPISPPTQIVPVGPQPVGVPLPLPAGEGLEAPGEPSRPGIVLTPGMRVLPARRGWGTVVAADLVMAWIALLSTMITAVQVVRALPAGFRGILAGLFPFFSFGHRRPPWGRVVEQATNLPVAGAAVAILDPTGKPRESVRTHQDGTFAALLPTGRYRLSVVRKGYRLAERPTGVALFPGELLYTGAPFAVTDAEAVVPVVVVLQSLVAKPVRVRLMFRATLEHLRAIHAQLALPLLLVGAALNSLVLWFSPSPLLVAVELLYAVFFAFELLSSRVVRRTVGVARDALRRAPVGLVILRLLDVRTRRILATKVTSPRGRFLLLHPPGIYALHVVHPAYLPYLKTDLSIRRGWGPPKGLTVHLFPRPQGATL